MTQRWRRGSCRGTTTKRRTCATVWRSTTFQTYPCARFSRTSRCRSTRRARRRRCWRTRARFASSRTRFTIRGSSLMSLRCPAWSTRSPSSASTGASPSRAWTRPGWWATPGRRPSGWTWRRSNASRARLRSTSTRRFSSTRGRTSAWTSPRSGREATPLRSERWYTSTPRNPWICRSRSRWRRASRRRRRRNPTSWRCAATARRRSPRRSPRRTPTSTPSPRRRSGLRPRRQSAKTGTTM